TKGSPRRDASISSRNRNRNFLSSADCPGPVEPLVVRPARGSVMKREYEYEYEYESENEGELRGNRSSSSTAPLRLRTRTRTRTRAGIETRETMMRTPSSILTLLLATATAAGLAGCHRQPTTEVSPNAATTVKVVNNHFNDVDVFAEGTGGARLRL